MITLKEHNVKPYAQLCEMLAVHQKCAYIAATGTGKSYVVGKYIEDHDLVDKTLVLVPSLAIQDNWRRLLPEVRVITYQALCTEKCPIRDEKLIVCDEMHHLGAEKWGRIYRKIIEKFTGKLVGITATPIRFLDKSRNMVEECFDNIAVEGLDLPGAISAGILPSFEYITALYNLPERIPQKSNSNKTTEKLFSRLDFMKSEYSFQNILKKHLNEGNHKIAVFVNKISGINEVLRLCRKVYPAAKHYVIHSEIKRAENKGTIDSFKASDGMCFIYTVDMFNEGVHVEGIDTIIMFRKTESPNIYLQQLGRALSTDMAGQKVKIFDFVANHRNMRAVKNGSGSVITWVQENITEPARQIVVRDYALEELEVLEKIQSITTGRWLPEEDALILEKYGTRAGTDELCVLMPTRTRVAICQRAGVLGLANSHVQEYTEEFLEDIRKIYPEMDGTQQLRAKYPQYTVATIQRKANEMGITRHGYKKHWTEEEDELLRNNADMSVKELQNLFPDRKYQSISRRKLDLGLVSPKMKWTPEMDEILMTHSQMTGAELQKNFFPDIEWRCINSRRRRIGVPQRIGFWTDERKQKLAAAYSNGDYSAVNAIPEFSHMSRTAVGAAARRYGACSPRTRKLTQKLEIARKEVKANGTDTETTGAADPADTKAEA